MPLVSILMPTYNGERFLRAQLDSILAQTCADFELIVADDGSTDGTRALLRRYADLDKRLRVLGTSGNLGQRARLAELMSNATGEYVSIADQDDVWNTDKTERLLIGIGDAPLAFGRSDLVDADGAPLGRTLLEAIGSAPDPTRRLRSLWTPLVSAHAALIRREWLDSAALHARPPFDWLIGLEALFSGGVRYVHDAVVRHRLHGGNQANAGAAERNGRKRPSRHHLVQSFSHLLPVRLQFWQMLDHLGRSRALDGAARRDFGTAADVCFSAWFSSWRRLGDFNDQARKALHDALDKRAGSEEDRMAFDEHVRLVTSSRFAPVNLHAGWTAFRGRGVYQ